MNFVMFKIKVWLWKWLFSDFAKQVDERVNQFLKEQANNFTQEQQAFMREMRESTRDDARKDEYRYKESERRHIEMVEAIKSLKPGPPPIRNQELLEEIQRRMSSDYSMGQEQDERRFEALLAQTKGHIGTRRQPAEKHENWQL